MQDVTLALHSIVRWFTVGAGVWAVWRAMAGWLGARPWGESDATAGRLYVIGMDLQLLLGALLYFVLGSYFSALLRDPAATMGNAGARFWAVEHVTLMLVAIVLAHLGRVLPRRQATDARRHRLTAILFVLSLLAVLVATPWPFSAVARPWLRLPW